MQGCVPKQRVSVGLVGACSPGTMPRPVLDVLQRGTPVASHSSSVITNCPTSSATHLPPLLPAVMPGPAGCCPLPVGAEERCRLRA